jgi:hypothetical protein
VEEYVRRFPRHEESLRRRFALHHAFHTDRPPDAEAGTLTPGASPEAATLPPPNRPPEAAGDFVPPHVPGYEVLAELGRGGMGVVYRARQVSLKRLVALKMILAGGHAAEQEVKRFRTEAEAVAQLRHPGIVQIYEIGTHDGNPFLALELVTGGSLASRLTGAPLPPPEAAGLIETLARVVHFAHTHGIIHRDLKPANILLQARPGGREADGLALAECEPKVTDFGLAKRLEGDVGQTKSGEILGTPSYMAPEQAAGKTREIGPLADVYSLGAILYELLTGRPPFRAETTLDTLLLVLEQEPAPVRQLNPKVPRNLETICLKCLRKAPGQRYGSADALADDLRRFLDGEPIKARPPGLAQRVGRWVRRHQALTFAYGVAALAVVAFLYYYPLIALPSWPWLLKVRAPALYLAVLPMAVTTAAAFGWARPRVLALGTIPLGLGAVLWWYFGLGAPTHQEGVLQLTDWLGGAALLGVFFGVLAAGWRSALLGFLPAVAVWAGLGWYLDHSARPVLLGALHGLLLGLIGRVTAWGFGRPQAAAALGALLGGLLGWLVVDLHGETLWNLVVASGLRLREYQISFLYYGETCFAYLGAIAAALLSRSAEEAKSRK